MRTAAEHFKNGGPDLPKHWDALVQETIISEVACRVFAAILVAHDHHHRRNECSAVARNVLLSHIDARCRLEAIVRDLGPRFAAEVEETTELLDACKRWSDMLVGQLLITGPVIEFAFDQARATDFAVEAVDVNAAKMIRGSFSQKFQPFIESDPFSPELNEQVALGIIGFFPVLVRERATGSQTWLSRVEEMASDTESWVDELLRS